MPVLTRERQADAEEAQRHAAADMLTAELLAALKLGDLNAPALFAPIFGTCFGNRHYTVGEVVLEQPCGTEDVDLQLLKLVVRLAYSADADLPHVARTLLFNIAHDFGDAHAEVTQ